MEISWWVFEKSHTPEQANQWWSHCYFDHPISPIVQDIGRSVIVLGEKGSGKSVLLDSFAFSTSTTSFVAKADIKTINITNSDITGPIGQIMVGVAQKTAEMLREKPMLLDNLSYRSAKYLRWLLDKYTGGKHRRTFGNLLNDLETRDGWEQISEVSKERLTSISELEFEDYYETDTDQFDIQGQIRELITLSRFFDYDQVTILVDINLRDNNITNFVRLFEWLPLFQIKDFSIKAAITPEDAARINLRELVRRRVTFSVLDWTVDQCKLVCDAHLKCASNRAISGLDDIAEQSLIEAITQKIPYLVQSPTPRYWLYLTQSLLFEYEQQSSKLELEQLKRVLQTYYEKFIKLIFDEKQKGVWRGPEFIKLTGPLFDFVSTLWDGEFSDEPNGKLVAVLGSKVNVNTVASRVRTKIEPLKGVDIYVKNTRQDGYWLENTEK